MRKLGSGGGSGSDHQCVNIILQPFQTSVSPDYSAVLSGRLGKFRDGTGIVSLLVFLSSTHRDQSLCFPS